MFKLAGVKNDKDFYAKFPDEETFMAKHGKAFKKASRKAQWGDMLKGIGESASTIGDTVDAAGNTIKGAPDLLGGAEGGIMDKLGGVAGIGSAVSGIGEGLSELKAEKQQLKQVTQDNQLADINLQAAQTIDVDSRRQREDSTSKQYATQMRPINGEELFPVNGVGTNVLAAKRGKTISSKDKYTKAMVGFDQIAGVAGGPLTSIADKISGSSGGGKLGGTIGKTVGKVVPIPGASQVLELAGTVAGNLLDKNPERIKKQQNQFDSKMEQLGSIGFAGQVQDTYSSYAQHGGTTDMENDGDVQIANGSLKPLSFNPYTEGEETNKIVGPTHKEGGTFMNIDGNKIEAEPEPIMQIAQHGTEEKGTVIFGDLPITKETAEMMGAPEAKGKNFKRYIENIAGKETKANMKKDKAIKVASNIIPVERFDRLKLDTQAIIEKGSDEKLKIYASDKEKAAVAQNSINETAEEIGIDPVALAKGEKYTEIALRKKSARKKRGEKKTRTAQHGTSEPNYRYQGGYTKAQGGINQQTEYFPGELEKIVPIPTQSVKNPFFTPQEQTEFNPYSNVGGKWSDGLDNKLDSFATVDTSFKTRIKDEAIKEIVEGKDSTVNEFVPGKGMGNELGSAMSNYTHQGRNDDGTYGDKVNMDSFIKKNSHWFDFSNFDPKNSNDVARLQYEYNLKTKGNRVDVDGKFGDQTYSMNIAPEVGSKDLLPIGSDAEPRMTAPLGRDFEEEEKKEKEGKGGFDPSGLAALAAPYFGRESDAERLNANQLYGEMFSLSHNKLEPVPATSYKPELDVPYDVSYQDALNRNTSSLRGAQKMAQGNPAAQAMLQAQAYGADQPILAQQFRDNQAMKNKVYSGNRATLNDAKLKNIDIFDKQATKQSIAKSNTKEATQLALNSISSKYAQNLKEQRTLKTYENMYDYRFGKDYKAQNKNNPVDFDAMADNAESETDPIWNTPGIFRDSVKKKKGKSAKYGTISKALKRF